MSYLERMIKSREEEPSHWQTLCKTSIGSSALNTAVEGCHLLHSAGGDQAQRHVFQRHANMSTKTTASKVLPKSLSELALMSDETVWEKLNDMDSTRPIKYKLRMKKDNTNLTKK